MRVIDVKRLKPLQRFIYWCNERYSVWKKRQAGLPPPWTDDTVIQTTYFTNVQREQDKVTVWMRENIRDPLKNDPAVLFAVACFRWFNYIPTGELLVKKNLHTRWQLKRAVKALRKIQDAGEQVFTGAYVITNGGSPKDKVLRVCEDYIHPIWKHRKHLTSRWDEECTLEGMHEALMTFPGLGGSGFMAAQVVADLKYTYLLEKAEDWWTWCSPGPGSIKGLNLALGRPTDAGKSPNFLEEVNYLREVLDGEQYLPPLHAQDVQNCCCEFSKYDRVLRGLGKVKRRYPSR